MLGVKEKMFQHVFVFFDMLFFSNYVRLPEVLLALSLEGFLRLENKLI